MTMDQSATLIYFVRNPKSGYVKIGKTQDFNTRYNALCAEAKCTLDVLLVVSGEDTESQLHHYFSSSRAFKKEWFYFDERMKELINKSKDSGNIIYPEGLPNKKLPVVEIRTTIKRQDQLVKKLSKNLEKTTKNHDYYKEKHDSYLDIIRYYMDEELANTRISALIAAIAMVVWVISGIFESRAQILLAAKMCYLVDVIATTTLLVYSVLRLKDKIDDQELLVSSLHSIFFISMVVYSIKSWLVFITIYLT
jgi:hypothetical protein